MGEGGKVHVRGDDIHVVPRTELIYSNVGGQGRKGEVREEREGVGWGWGELVRRRRMWDGRVCRRSRK